MERSIFSVFQVNQYIKSILEDDFLLNGIHIMGELSNFKNHPSGHLYFTLKDEHAAINCVMFRQSTRLLDFKPENGMKVVACGRISLYEKTGQYQLYVDQMDAVGLGKLYEEFERLKNKLLAEGLFDNELKKPVPAYVNCVAVITSGSGAAVRDIIQIIKRRNKTIKIAIIPVLVQGENAAEDIVQALSLANNWGKADVIIIGRGGGSFEDLQAFNEEVVARAIFASEIPVISAVGHETDFTIADFVADLRAPTPSAAAEIVSYSLEDLIYRKDAAMSEIKQLSIRKIKTLRENINSLQNRRVFKEPCTEIFNRQLYVHSLYKRASGDISRKLQAYRNELNMKTALVNSLSPSGVLKRGYALITDENNNMITGISSMEEGHMFNINMRDGKAAAKLIEKTAEKEGGN